MVLNLVVQAAPGHLDSKEAERRRVEKVCFLGAFFVGIKGWVGGGSDERGRLVVSC